MEAQIALHKTSLSNTEVNENSTEAGTITATDDNLPLSTPLYLDKDEDNSKFALNTTTGYLTFPRSSRL